MNEAIAPRRLVTTAALALVLATGAQAAPLEADFNGDGLTDLVVGQPSKRINGKANAGAVSVFYGRRAGPASAPHEQYHGDVGGFGREAGPGERFGEAVASGDFDADGFDDLVIGIPFDRLNPPGRLDGTLFSGVQVVFGRAGGFRNPTVLNRTQALNPSILQSPQLDDSDPEMGQALIAGDWNGDGFDDLAIGMPGADLRLGGTLIRDAGAVAVFFGGTLGFRSSSAFQRVLTQALALVPGSARADNRFGMRLLSGDFDGDGCDDLVIGSPFDKIDGKAKAGSVTLLTCGPGGVFPFGASLVVDHPGTGGIEVGDEFGDRLAAGDFNGDGRLDLAVGHRLEDGSKNGEGFVTVLHGTTPGGITNASPRVFWHQRRSDVPGESELADHLGAALAAADFDRDGFDDLAIGIPDENFEGFFSSTWDAGRVLVLYGSTQSLRVRGGGVSDWDRDSVGVQSPRGAGDRFGAALAAGDWNGDGIADLLIGVPGEDLSMTNGTTRRDAGMAQVLYGTRQGLSAFPELGRQSLHGGRVVAEPIHAEALEKFGERFLQ